MAEQQEGRQESEANKQASVPERALTPQQERLQEAREILAEFLCNVVDHGQDRSWSQLSEPERGDYREDADGFLNTCDSEGKPIIAVIDSDQCPPNCPDKIMNNQTKKFWFFEGELAMIND